MSLEIPLDIFFTDFVTEAIKPIPDDASSKEYFMKINKKKVPYHIIGKKKGMFYENIAFMMDCSVGRIQKRFSDLIKELRLDEKRFYLMEYQHYDYINPNYRSELKSDWSHKGGKPVPFIYFEGITIIIGFMRGEIRNEVFLCWNEQFHHEIRKRQKLQYQPTNPKQIPPIAGSLISKNGLDCKSKMELIAVNLFHDLMIDIGVKQTIHISELSKKSQRLMDKYNFTYLDYDFWCQTKPFTLIDVQGMTGKLSYYLKSEVAKIEGWSLFIVYKNEDKNVPGLKQRIIDNFITKKIMEKD